METRGTEPRNGGYLGSDAFAFGPEVKQASGCVLAEDFQEKLIVGRVRATGALFQHGIDMRRSPI